jgi:hypothetical protein
MALKPDLGFCISDITGDGKHVISVDRNGLASDAGLIDGDVVVSLDGLSLAEFRASEWWPRPQGKPIKVVYHRRGMIHRGNIVVGVFDAPAAAVGAGDSPATAVPEDHAAPDASVIVEDDVAPDAPVGPDTSAPDNAEIFETFGRPIGDQSWRYGRGCVSDYGGCTTSPTPTGHADNWGDIDNWRTSTPPQAPHGRGRDWYDK